MKIKLNKFNQDRIEQNTTNYNMKSSTSYKQCNNAILYILSLLI